MSDTCSHTCSRSRSFLDFFANNLARVHNYHKPVSITDISQSSSPSSSPHRQSRRLLQARFTPRIISPTPARHTHILDSLPIPQLQPSPSIPYNPYNPSNPIFQTPNNITSFIIQARHPATPGQDLSNPIYLSRHTPNEQPVTAAGIVEKQSFCMLLIIIHCRQRHPLFTPTHVVGSSLCQRHSRRPPLLVGTSNYKRSRYKVSAYRAGSLLLLYAFNSVFKSAFVRSLDC
ncbi:hypothetical protein BU24DRAFT_427212 [Aaosphaeria arxii CBS 175.79]|uniref:Uncharacterized protein n=1 Tax=Aaosphaeria arxii CBS 175.79 TaxID=1450172 RepID=A0A6A5XDT4_9PLEO|nr:uncharacterized protein BU24DRAFT_427212 [Aaosphaeria arxii CBS 175.79]KAF2011011.1 hypothetical protein BU24DRAFT_427212 [Aaosphaeria arxii CBS 175.79]